MKNLAGIERYEAEACIVDELGQAGVPIAADPRQLDHPEVKSAVIGRLGQFEFRRSWRYYVVGGPVPLEVARRLHEHPVGRTDVRVAGHCGCPPPEPPWVETVAGRVCVTCYHVDSVEGLRLLADAVRDL